MSYVVIDTSGNRYKMNHNKTTITRTYSYDRKYSTAGTYYWTCPANCTAVTSVQVAGGGGGYGWDCQCDCDCCGGDGCIIKGRVLTDNGFVDVSELRPGMTVFDFDGNGRRLMFVATNTLNGRKVVRVGDNLFTDEHSYIAPNGSKCTVNFPGYVASLDVEFVDGETKGRYMRETQICLASDTDLDYEVLEMPADTKTYTLVVEGADFVKMDGVVASCARAMR